MSLKASDVMNRSLKTATPTTPLGEVHQIMASHNIRHVLIIDPEDSKLKGIISDRDIKKFLSPFIGSARESDQDRATLKIPVGKVMQKKVIAIRPSDPLKLAVENMLAKKISAVPVVESDGSCLGMVTTVDIMRAMLQFL